MPQANEKTNEKERELTDKEKLDVLIQRLQVLEEVFRNHRHYDDGTPGTPL